MRDALAILDGERLTVQATVLRFSRFIGWGGVRQPTLLLGQVTTLEGAVLTDHLWLHLGKRLTALDLHTGDLLQFSGRVAVYRRGLKRLPGEPAQYSTDYALVYPTRCRVAARAVRPEPVPVMPKEPPPPARGRILAMIETLWREGEEPPSLPNLYGHLVGMAPTTFLRRLHNLAKEGTITFTGQGRVLLAAVPAHSLEGSLSHDS